MYRRFLCQRLEQQARFRRRRTIQVRMLLRRGPERIRDGFLKLGVRHRSYGIRQQRSGQPSEGAVTAGFQRYFVRPTCREGDLPHTVLATKDVAASDSTRFGLILLDSGDFSGGKSDEPGTLIARFRSDASRPVEHPQDRLGMAAIDEAGQIDTRGQRIEDGA